MERDPLELECPGCLMDRLMHVAEHSSFGQSLGIMARMLEESTAMLAAVTQFMREMDVEQGAEPGDNFETEWGSSPETDVGFLDELMERAKALAHTYMTLEREAVDDEQIVQDAVCDIDEALARLLGGQE